MSSVVEEGETKEGVIEEMSSSQPTSRNNEVSHVERLLLRDTRAIASACSQAVRTLADSHFDATVDDKEDEEVDLEVIETTVVPRMEKVLHLSDEDINQVLERKADLDEYDRLVDRVLAIVEQANLESSFEKELERHLYDARTKLIEAGGGERSAIEFIRQFILETIEKVIPVPEDQVNETKRRLKQVLKLRDDADRKMMTHASNGNYAQARAEEKRLIGHDKASLRLNRALRDASSHYQITSIENVHRLASNFLEDWQSKLLQPQKAASLDNETLHSYRVSLEDSVSTIREKFESDTQELRNRAEELELERKKNYEALVRILSKELGRSLEHRDVMKQMDNLRIHHKRTLRVARERDEKASRSQKLRRDLEKRMDVGMRAVSSLASLEAKKMQALNNASHDSEEIARTQKLLREHYDLTRKALGVLLAKSERLKRRVVVLESKEAEYQFQMKHAFETEMPEAEILQVRKLSEDCRRQIALALKHREAYEARAKVLCNNEDFQNTMRLLENEFADPRTEVQDTLAADESVYLEDLKTLHKRQEELTRSLFSTGSTTNKYKVLLGNK
ncbi:hypothetical protein OAV88_00555 [bacterium]|nr:hypothetical protein [bacterium]